MEIQMKNQVNGKASVTIKSEGNSKLNASDYSSLAGWHRLLAVLLSDGLVKKSHNPVPGS